MQPSLGIKLHDRIQFDNPFMLASGPPGTNGKVIAKSFDLGWGGVVIKTISLDSSKVINTAPRYGKLRSRETGEVIGFENIELISNRPFDTWLDELRQLKKNYPKHVLIASIMKEYAREAWHEIVRRVQETGVDAFELNLSCPHGLPERKMGMAMGEGFTVAGGYSGQAVRPIALRQVMEIARAFPGTPISGMGGIETGADAAQFLLLGSHTVQVCTGAMLRGYEIIAELKRDLEKFMVDHEFTDLRQFIGKSLAFFSTHHDLVSRQKQAKADRAVASNRDAETWKGAIARETESLTTN